MRGLKRAAGLHGPRTLSLVAVAALVGALLLLPFRAWRGRRHARGATALEQQFRLLTESVEDHAILMLDPAGRVASWNRGAQRIKGWREPEILGRHFSCFYPPEDVAAGKPEHGLAHAREHGHYVTEGWRVRADGTRFWASVSIAAIRGDSGELRGYAKVTRDLTERKRVEDALRAEMEERARADGQLRSLNRRLEDLVSARTSEIEEAHRRLREAHGNLQELSARLIRAQEEERARIARELHDETGQALTLIRMRLSELERQGVTDRPAIRECVGVVDRAVVHIRRLSLNLRPPMLDDLGLPDALEWVLQEQAQSAGWHWHFEAGGIGDSRYPVEIETACFRIGQEALTNAARHARAAHVEVLLERTEGGLRLTVRDDGAGFVLERYRSREERRKHFGLVSMEERARLAGGEIQILSSPGGGTRLLATFPVEAEPALQ